ncbi:hypothetical protein D9756_001367 [Leucocoprinus leucothites]|uniref:Vacuolar protein sorting-associated protein 54 C-terminal domain-containing protein n=1 Tax=Leucocoprinus leucothites TaxID=201217 RepID=A0A8H5LIA1_9AGAR|nr:hypothetical protein D9756_001367 [Leucoagaricus leucothites]
MSISTVLNNPHKKQAAPKAHSSLPAVPPADLPRVRRKDFDSYLKAIAPEWVRFERNNRLGREGQAQLDSSALHNHDDDDSVTPRASMTSDANHLTPTASAPPLLPTPSSSSRRDSLIPLYARSIPSLESVPSVFFKQGFHLANPSTFAKVTEQPNDPAPFSSSSSSSSTLVSAPVDYITDPTSSLSHTPPLLDKFSHYADTVEQHLVREISLRSTSFFAALTNLQDLQSESDVCLDRIAKLRGLLKDVDERTAKRGLEVVKKCNEVERVQGIREAVKGVGNVIEMTRVAKSLVGAGQWGEALNVVEELETMWEGEQVDSGERVKLNGGNGAKLETMIEETEDEESLSGRDGHKPILGFPLSALSAFSELPVHLRALTLEVATSLSQELIVVLRHDLEERVNRSPGAPEKANGHVVNYSTDEGLRDRLKPLLQNLVRTRGLKDAISQWREVVMGEVRRVPKEMVSGFDKEWNEDNEENRATLVQHLKAMEHRDFMPILQKLYQRFLALVEGVQAQNGLIGDLLDLIQKSVISRRPPASKATPPNVTEDLSDLLSSTTELSHTTSAKLLHARMEPHSILPFPHFLALYYDSMAFVVKCEVLCRRMIIGLRGVVVRQASVYLSKFHQGRIERCAKVVLDEMWNQVEIGADLQGVVDVLVRCAVRDAEELRVYAEGAVLGSPNPGGAINGTKGKENGHSSPTSPTSKAPKLHVLPPTKTFAELSEADSVPSSDSKESTKSGGSAKGNSKHLKIEDRSYYIVSATAEILILLVDYLKIVINLSTLTKDTINKVVEFLMTFNSRTCQLVLGAGAMRSAGLKHITAKHLALASQSLSIVSELIPYVRETFRRHLNHAEAVLLVDFDKLKRLRNGVMLGGSRIARTVPVTIDWNQPNDGGINGYMQTLVKETVTLHKVLSRYLSAAVVEVRMRLVCDILSNMPFFASPKPDTSTRGPWHSRITPEDFVPSLIWAQEMMYVMSEVFAGINHRLSEVYGKIELPNQEAKARLLADAKFLHKELSGLKNVMAPMGMLETVVSEKQVPRATTSSPTPAPVPAPTRSNTLTANQRLKGLLSRSSTNANHSNKIIEKALPNPNQTVASPRTSTSSPSPPPPPAKSPAGNLFMQNALASASTLRVLSVSPPPMEGAGSEPQGEFSTTSLQSQQNGHEDQTSEVSPDAAVVEPSLPEIPSTERTTDMKVMDRHENGLAFNGVPHYPTWAFFLHIS